MKPEEKDNSGCIEATSGFGYSLEEAVRKIAKDNPDPKNNHFEFNEVSLSRIWNRHKELKGKPLTLLDLELLD